MNVTFACPECDAANRSEFTPQTERLDCAACGHQTRVPNEIVEGNRVIRCLACPSTDLFVRKDFPQRLGVTIVVLGFIASSVAWYFYYTLASYAMLFGTAAIDVLLYALVGNSLVCYRCHAEYRQVEPADHQGSFNLETHERYRQEAARLAERQRLSPGARSAGDAT